MGFNGNNVIDITEHMWMLTKADIAVKYLGLNKSGLSRPEKPYNYDVDDFYKKLYDPDNEASPASGESKPDLLVTLKLVIEDIKGENYKDALISIWEFDDYVKFTKEMLLIGKRGTRALKTKKKRKSVSLCHILPEKPLCIGREKEIETISEIFKDYNYAVLYGISGIGKSVAALEYAHKLHAGNNEFIIQNIVCNETDTIRNAVERIAFDGFQSSNEKHTYDERVKTLLDLKKPSLIIFDNLNCQIGTDDYDLLKKITNSGAIEILITRQSSEPFPKSHTVKVNVLGSSDELELYGYHRFNEGVNEEYIRDHRDIILAMFELVYNHTLMIELLAKLCRSSGTNEEDIFDQLNTGFELPSDILSVEKDEQLMEDKYKEILEMIFNISNLSDARKDILRHLSLIRPEGIGYLMFKELMKLENNVDVNSLRNDGWIITAEESQKICLHPLIRDMVFGIDDTKPSYQKCKVFFEGLIVKMDDMDDEDLEEDTWNELDDIMTDSVNLRGLPPHIRARFARQACDRFTRYAQEIIEIYGFPPDKFRDAVERILSEYYYLIKYYSDIFRQYSRYERRCGRKFRIGKGCGKKFRIKKRRRRKFQLGRNYKWD